MKAAFRIFLLLGAVIARAACAAGGPSRCENAIRVDAAPDYAIFADSGRVAREIEPEFFGFNLEWIDFQSSLWESAKRRASPVVSENLNAFPGAVYRYPGGGAANHFRWHDAVGNADNRPKKSVADWLGPVSPDFGFEEFLAFVQSVGGKPWIVLNLYGNMDGETDKASLRDSALAWIDDAMSRERAGSPRVLRWELGNELDRGPRKSWPPEKYARVASMFGLAINARHPGAKTVVALQDWKAQKSHTVGSYNRRVIADLKVVSHEFAHHLYFDALPNARDIPHRFSVICQTLDNARQIGIENPLIWITEYGRDIPHPYDSSPWWKNSWPQTANLQAALGLADALVLATQIREIAGMFVHALATTKGPWPLFHADRNGILRTSVTFQALRLLREGMLPVVLETNVRSANASGYQGGYDHRATVMTNSARNRFTVWAINRSPGKIQAKLAIAGMEKRAVAARHRYLSADTPEASNYASAGRVTVVDGQPQLSFDASGLANIELPPYSVSSFEFAR